MVETTVYELVVEPWLLGDWMWRGALASGLAAVSCATLGVFLYLRRMSMLSDALAHVALLGIVVAFLLSGDVHPLAMIGGATLAGLLASLGIEALASRPRVRPDAAIGIVFTALFALGVVLLSTGVHDAHIDLDCVLFGNVLGISDHSLALLAWTTPLVLLAVALGWRWLAASSFDAGFARTLGVPVVATHYALMAGASATCVASFEAVGAVLVIALIIIPAATAHLLCDRLHAMIAVAWLHALLSLLLGLYAAVWLDCSPAGAMVVAAGALYALVYLFAPRHGLVAQAMARRSLRRGNADGAIPIDEISRAALS